MSSYVFPADNQPRGGGRREELDIGLLQNTYFIFYFYFFVNNADSPCVASAVFASCNVLGGRGILIGLE